MVAISDDQVARCINCKQPLVLDEVEVDPLMATVDLPYCQYEKCPRYLIYVRAE